MKMPLKEESIVKSPHFPVILFSVAILFTLFVLLVLALDNYYAKTAIGQSNYLVIVTIIDIILLVTAWYFTYKSINRWKIALIEKTQLEVGYLKEIETTRNYLNEVLMINHMSDQLQTCKTSSDAYAIVENTAMLLFPGLSGALCIKELHENKIVTVQQWGDISYLKPDFIMDDCWGLREGHIYIVNEMKKDIICDHFNCLPMSGYMCLPLIIQSGTLGILVTIASQNAIFTDKQRQMATIFGEVLKLSLTNITLRETLSEQATVDSLTGLYNRRYLDLTLPLQLSRASRNNAELCVAMLDLDHYKRINDTYGHEAGDEVLKFIGRILKENFRNYDHAFRYGGEEFVLIVEGSLKNFLPRLQKICEILRNTHITFQEHTLPIITVSIGVTEVAGLSGDHSDEIIHAVDEALYKAKAGGRDRIEIATSTHL